MRKKQVSSDDTEAVSRGPFAVGLFLTIVLVALVAEVPLAMTTGRSVAFDDALTNGLIVGSVFSVVYLAGTVLTSRLFDSKE